MATKRLTKLKQNLFAQPCNEIVIKATGNHAVHQSTLQDFIILR